MDRVKPIWYLSPMRAAKVQASLRIRAVSPEPLLLAYTSSESRGTFRQKARSQAPLNGWACAVKICHDGMLENTNSLDAAHMLKVEHFNQNDSKQGKIVIYYIDCDSVMNKRDELELELETYKPDIVVLTEMFPKGINSTDI